MTESSKSVACFGAFEVDLRAGELRKQGFRIRIEEQPFQVLAELLSPPGELVTREDLCRKLWPDNPVSDFDRSLNTAINKLRRALGDSAAKPRFIATVPRQGYRFIAPVEIDEQVEPGPETPASAFADEASPGTTGSLESGVRHAVGVAALVAVFVAAGLAARVFVPRASSLEHLPPPVPLTSYPGNERSASFSPDGTQVAYSWDGEDQEDYDIHVQVIGSGSRLQLTSDPADDSAPAWSPDGTQIAFIRSAKDREKIYVVSPLGGLERQVAELSANPPSGLRLAWSRNSASLFTSVKMSREDPLSIYRISTATGEKRRFTRPPRNFFGDFYPSVSPDGERLAWVRRITEATDMICVAPIAGGDTTEIRVRKAVISGLAWSPDGRDLVFSSSWQSGNLSRLYRISASGGPARLLFGTGQGGYFPSVSWQGGQLVYEQREFDNNIWLFDQEGLQSGKIAPRQVVASTRSDRNPQFSPDGARIAFGSTRSGHEEIWICNRDGSNPIQLTSFEGPEAGMPRWSPDGKSIVFDCDPEGHFDVYVIDVEGGAPRKLTRHSAQDSRPSWSGDGLWIYFNSNRTGSFQVWKMRAEGGDPIQLTNDGGYHPVESPDGRFVYYAKHRMNEGPGLWRVPTRGGKEAAVMPRLENAGLGRWCVTDQGLYFLDENYDTARPGLSSWFLKLLRLENQQTVTIAEMKRPPSESAPLAVSPDGKSLLYCQVDRSSSDLLLIEDFR